MTKNQIDAIRNIETQRHNKEQERVERILIPAQYISSIGSLLRGASGFMSIGSSKGFKGNSSPYHRSTNYSNKGGKYNAPYLTPTEWTIQ